MATGRYQRFLPELVDTARRHVVGLERVFVLSERRPSLDSGDLPVVWLPWGHAPWPLPTLMRYSALTA